MPTETAPPTRVFLVDDHELVRDAVSHLVASTHDLQVVGEASTAAQAINRIHATHPDVVVLDVRLPDGTGVEVCRRLRESDPQSRCLLLTSYDDEGALYSSILAGAAGYVIKDIRGFALIEAIRTVAQGGSLIGEAARRRAVASLEPTNGADPRLSNLSPRLREVLRMLAGGLTNREIAARLCVASRTADGYVAEVLQALGVERRAPAVAIEIDSRYRFASQDLPPVQTFPAR